MVHDGSNWRMKTRRDGIDLSAAVAVAGLSQPAVHAQSIMRTPNLNVGSRMPTINPTVTPRINANIAGAHQCRDRRRQAAFERHRRRPRRCVYIASIPNSTMPYARFSPNLYPVCQAVDRGGDGECSGKPAASGAGGGSGKSAKKGKGRGRQGHSQAAVNLRTVPNELVAEIDGSLSTAEADALARRHGLERIASQNFPLLGGTIGLFRIVDRRPLETVRREFAADASVRSSPAQFPLFPAGSEEVADRGRCRAIRRRAASVAAGPPARSRHERHHRGDQFRRRRQTSRTRQFDRRQFRCARQQGRPARPWHRHCGGNRRACAG